MTCLLIPHWALAVVGFVLLMFGIFCLDKVKEKIHFPHWEAGAVFGITTGFILLAYGIAPYLPCVAVVP